MKKLFVLAMALLLPLTACAEAKYEQGKQYDVVADVATSKPEVKEFFSFSTSTNNIPFLLLKYRKCSIFQLKLDHFPSSNS